MLEGQRRSKEFAEVLQNDLGRLWREGVERVERQHVEELGQRVGMDRTEASEAFMALRGDVWEGDIVESDEEPGWEAVVLKSVSPTGLPKGSGPL